MKRSLDDKASEKTKTALVDLWLAFDGNEAAAILKAFKLGLDEGKRTRRKAKR